MSEQVKELRSILIQLLAGLGESKVRIMTTMAIIAAHQLEDEMVSWVSTYYGKEDMLTLQKFTKKLNQLIAERS